MKIIKLFLFLKMLSRCYLKKEAHEAWKSPGNIFLMKTSNVGEKIDDKRGGGGGRKKCFKWLEIKYLKYLVPHWAKRLQAAHWKQRGQLLNASWGLSLSNGSALFFCQLSMCVCVCVSKNGIWALIYTFRWAPCGNRQQKEWPLEGPSLWSDDNEKLLCVRWMEWGGWQNGKRGLAHRHVFTERGADENVRITIMIIQTWKEEEEREKRTNRPLDLKGLQLSAGAPLTDD